MNPWDWNIPHWCGIAQMGSHFPMSGIYFVNLKGIKAKDVTRTRYHRCIALKHLQGNVNSYFK